MMVHIQETPENNKKLRLNQWLLSGAKKRDMKRIEILIKMGVTRIWTKDQGELINLQSLMTGS